VTQIVESQPTVDTPAAGVADKRAQRLRMAAGLALWAAATIYFLRFFNAGIFQPSVDAAWVVASVAWLIAFWRSDTPSLPRLRQPFWLYILYLAALAPFIYDWRWVMAGDSHAYAHMGIAVTDHGPYKSLLSADGPDQYGYLQMNLDHILMYLFEPNVFWSRFAKLIVGALTMASIFTVVTRLVTRPFGILVALCSSTCSAWLVYTYGYLPFLNGIAAGFTLVAVGLWVRRDIDSRRAWLTLGAFSGFMLFLTPNGWFMAPFIWTWVGVVALLRGKVTDVVLAAATTLVVGLPMLLQWQGGGHGQLFTLVETPNYTLEKVTSFFIQAATYPFSSGVYDSGGFGPQLPPGFRWLFIVGVLVTPLFPRYFPGARFMFLLWLWNVVVVTLSQGPYAAVSVKRALILIPMATYFVFLPFWKYLKSTAVVLAIALVWASFGVRDLVYNMAPGRTGYTLIDGAMEANQRFGPDVCLYLPGDGRAENFVPGSALDRMYGFLPEMRLVDDPKDPSCRVVCWCSQPQCVRLDPVALGYTPLEMLNTVELGCARTPAAETIGNR
jgi:hypothetical protein